MQFCVIKGTGELTFLSEENWCFYDSQSWDSSPYIRYDFQSLVVEVVMLISD